MIDVGAYVAEDSLSSAAFGLGLDVANVSRSGVIRAALALFHGYDRNEAREYVQSKRNARLGSDGLDWARAKVPEEFADTGDTNLSMAIRIGLAMAAGLSRKQAENYARTVVPPVGYPAGKPRKIAS